MDEFSTLSLTVGTQRESLIWAQKLKSSPIDYEDNG